MPTERKLLARLDESINNVEAGSKAATITALTAVAADVALALAASANLRLLGYAVRESATVAAAASADIRHGGVAGDLISPVSLAADGVKEQWYGGVGIACPDGVSIDVIAGTLDITLFYST